MSDIKNRTEESISSAKKDELPDKVNKIALSNKNLDSKASITSSAYDATDDEFSAELKSMEGYDETLEWTEEEETKVRRKIDFRLLPFMLLMAFVLNMDRTNHCKLLFSILFILSKKRPQEAYFTTVSYYDRILTFLSS